MADNTPYNNPDSVAGIGYMENLQKALGAYADLATDRRMLVTTQAQQQGQNWRAAVSGLARYDSAINAGESAAAIRALTDMTLAPLMQKPIDRNLIDSIVQQVAADHEGVKPTDAVFKRAVWQQYAMRSASANMDPTTLGTIEALQNAYGDPFAEGALDASDQVAKDNLQRAFDFAAEQQKYVDMGRGMMQSQTAAKEWLAQNPNPPEDVANTFLHSLPVTHAAAGIPEMLAYAQKNADRPVKLEGAAKELDDQMKAAQELILSKATAETERDQRARIMALPKFQHWAEANGFHVGHVEPAEPGRDYGPNNVVTPVGVYVVGPDDEKALRFAERQIGKSPDAPHPFLHNQVKTTPTYGKVTVKREGAFEPDTSYQHPDGKYYYEEDKGVRTYKTPEEVAALRTQAQHDTVLAKVIAARPGLSEQDAEAATKALLAAQPDRGRAEADAVVTRAVHMGEEPPKKALTETITGQFDAPWYGDPLGSVRLNGTLYAPEQLVGDPVVVGGGKDRPLKRYIEESKTLRKINTATRMENNALNEKVPFDAASWVAQTLHPPVKSVAEEQRNSARADAASVKERAANQTASEVADATGRDVQDVKKMQTIPQGGMNPYVETNAEQLKNELALNQQREVDRAKAEKEQNATRAAIGGPLLPGERGKVIGPVDTSPDVRMPRGANVPDVTPAAQQREALVRGGPPSTKQAPSARARQEGVSVEVGNKVPDSTFKREDTAPKSPPPWKESGKMSNGRPVMERDYGTKTSTQGLADSNLRLPAAATSQRDTLITPTAKDVKPAAPPKDAGQRAALARDERERARRAAAAQEVSFKPSVAQMVVEG